MIDIAIPCINRLDLLQKMVKSICDTAILPVRLIVLDNGSTEDLETYSKEIGAKYIRNIENYGLFHSYNQAMKESTAEWLAYFHNDIEIYEKGWDLRLKNTVRAVEVEHNTKIGIVGFSGSRAGGADGSRQNFMSNLQKVAEIHGRRMTKHEPAVFVDGSTIVCRREMLDKIGGWDEGYKVHHIYDYDISMASLDAGYMNMVLGIDFYHWGGETAIKVDLSRLSFEKKVREEKELSEIMAQGRLDGKPILSAEQAIIEYNTRRFFKKWTQDKKMLPCTTTNSYKLLK